MEETKLKNHFIGMKDNVLYLRECGSNWTSTYDPEESILTEEKEMIFEHTINNLKVGNSIQLNKSIKTFNSQKYLKSLPITNFLNDNIGYIYKSKLYKSKGLKNNGLTKIIISNPDNNMY